MTKTEFLNELDKKLSGLPEQDRARSIEYYSEIIDDRVEEGVSEEEAIGALGNIDDIASQIVSEIPLPKLIKARFESIRSMKVWEVILAVFGFLIVGIPVIAAMFSVAITIYASLWVVSISLFAAPIALIGSGIVDIIGFLYLLFTGNAAGAFFTLGTGLVALGLTLPFFYVAKYIAKFIIFITKSMILFIKKSFIKKEEKQ